jgi:hypothetical protein
LNAIQSLQDGESIEVSYGKNRKGEPETYSIKAYKSYNDEMSYSIWNSFQGMNIEKIGKTTMKAYTYDMMSQKTTWTFPLYELNIIK